MKPLLWAIGLGMASSLSVAQLRVENPKHLDYPRQGLKCCSARLAALWRKIFTLKTRLNSFIR
jgi:hypothetical protein